MRRKSADGREQPGRDGGSADFGERCQVPVQSDREHSRTLEADAAGVIFYPIPLGSPKTSPSEQSLVPAEARGGRRGSPCQARMQQTRPHRAHILTRQVLRRTVPTRRAWAPVPAGCRRCLNRVAAAAAAPAPRPPGAQACAERAAAALRPPPRTWHKGRLGAGAASEGGERDVSAAGCFSIMPEAFLKE